MQGTPKISGTESGTGWRAWRIRHARWAARLGVVLLASCSENPVAVRVPDRISIAVPVPSGRLSVGETAVLRATVAAGLVSLPMAEVVWSSSAPTILSVVPGGVLVASARGSAEITAAMASDPRIRTSVFLSVVGASALSLDTRTLALSEGGQHRLTATVAYDDGATATPLTWRSSVPAVALVDHQGLVTAVGSGTTIIRASGSGKSDSAVVTVSPQTVGSVTIDSVSKTAFFIGDRRTWSATVRNAGGALLIGRTIAWSSANPAVATVSTAGVVTAVGAGTTTISAESGGRVAEAEVVVLQRAASVSLVPASLRIPRGRTEVLAAAVRNAAGALLPERRSVSWSSSAPTVATVSTDGAVTAVGNGTASITATLEGVSGTAAITVVDPVASVLVTPTAVTLPAGASEQMTASGRDAKGASLTGRPVAWASSNPAVATINASGIVTAVAAGSANITATVEGVDATATVTVLRPVASVHITPPQPTLFVGRTLQLSASARDAQGTALTGRAVSWSTSDPTVATITAAGLVTAVAAGSATITATVEGIETTATLTLVPLPPALTGITVSADTVTLFVGRTRAITATVDQPSGATVATVTFGTALPSVATVSAAGVITAVSPGTATITATAAVAANGNFAAATQTARIEVIVLPVPVASAQITPGTVNLVVGGAQQLTTTVRDSVGAPLTGRITSWSSSNTAVVSVSATGLVTAVAEGTATLTVNVEGAVATALVYVGPLPASVTSLTVSPDAHSLIKGQTRALTPVVTKPAGAPAATITYGTTDPAVATISSSGVITANAPGTATMTVTATAPGNTNFAAATLSGFVAVTVVNAVASVQVTPGTTIIMPGSTQQLATTVRDSTGVELTGRPVVWTTSSAAVATVSATGLVTAIAVGTATITATVGGVPGTATFTVSPLPAAVTAVAITPTAVSLLVGRTAALSPVITQPSGAATASVTYGTTTPSVATVSAAGLIVAVGPGTATITFTATAVANTGFAAASKSATMTVTVTAVPVATVSVAPDASTILAGAAQQLVVIARDSAGQTLTGRTVAWATLNAAAATVNASGLVTGVAAGSATITATIEGIIGAATITVFPAPASITSLTVAPSSATVTVGQTRALTPTVTQPTGATTATVTYSSSDVAVATVSPTGVVTAVAAGTATIAVTATAPSNASVASTTVSSSVVITVVP
ncbi:MAG: Ig-like domain-containing protein [Gemmatimonadota bacterium]|nr:Ig-like domain-containing protein [Gemmatimonadota bacterium]MDQ8168595.1 Ig-like domain-containing protein [Gemmatimonadota bacterium]MDQ8171498.1 Ig-like domain-containing protein [Gemmatimonadota bacterium]